MRITGFQRPVQGNSKHIRRSGDQFKKSLTGTSSTSSRNVEQATSKAAVNNVSTVDSLVILQDVNVDGERRRKAIKHGGDVLDNLDKIRLELLSGRVSVNRLLNLRSLISTRPDHTDDPQLKSLLDQIELRARVELAKLDQ